MMPDAPATPPRSERKSSHETVHLHHHRSCWHPRPSRGPAGEAAKALDSTVTIAKADGKSAAATKLMAVMGLGVKTGETITFTIEGGDEEASAAAMEQFCKDNM